MYSLATANLVSLLVAVSFVVAVHLRQPLSADRNEPKVIKGRIIRVLLLTFALTGLLPIVLTALGGYPTYSYAFSEFGLQFGPLGVLKCLGLISTLYCGPLLDHFYDIDFELSTLYKDVHAELTLIWGIRDLVFAPIVEEIIYRSHIICIYRGVAGILDSWLTFGTPLFFGVAHLHHGYALYLSGQRAFFPVLATVAAQLVYTTAFGALASHLFLRFGTVWGPVVVHSVCNCMSFPTLEPGINPILYYGLLALGSYLFYQWL